MTTWIKDNLVLVSGIVLPVLLVAGFFALNKAPQLLMEPPDHDFLVVAYHYDHQHPRDFHLSFEVRDGQLRAKATPIEDGQNYLNRQHASLFRYIAADNRFEEVIYNLPDGLDDEVESLDFPIDTTRSLELDRRSKSPDGFSFEYLGYRGGGGALGEIFGMRSRRDSAYALNKNGAIHPLPRPNASQYYNQHDVQFMGWVISDGGCAMNARGQAIEQIVELATQYNLDKDEILSALQKNQLVPQAERSSGILARVLAYLGGIFVLAGIAIFIGMQWDLFNSATRVLVTLGTGFAIYLFALVSLSDDRFSRVTTPMLLISALLQPTGIVVMLNEYSYGGDPEHGLLFMCVVMFVQQFMTFLATQRTVLLFTSLFFGAAGFGTLCEIMEIDHEFVFMVLGIGLTAISWSIDKTIHRDITPFWYFAGSVFFLAGTFEILEGSPLEIIYFGIAAGVMYLGTVVRSRTLLFTSVLALMTFTGYFFRDSLANAFGLIVMGLLLIGLSVLAMNLNRKYIQGKE